PPDMAAPAVLPRLVIRGVGALSWDGVVPWREVVEPLDNALQEFGRVLLWDLGGIERNRPNLEILRRFEGESLWVDAGVRIADSVIDVLIAGAERAVVGTKTLRALEEFDDARELTENLVPLLDFVRGKLWAAESFRDVPPADLLRAWREAGMDTALVLEETGEFPRPLLDKPPEGLSVYAGLVPKTGAASLPRGQGAIVDFWEVVPRRT
ncbi:MAG TPA: HisA/HisF-related TIM barrel protein, partial [Thermoplasmata archaeon]|nr:HisA/HisF-related TIM barrel protein [Thermoplasmata archaeon]